MDLAAFFATPWGAVAIVAAAFILPKVKTAVAPFLAKLKSLTPATPTPAPIIPLTPAPVDPPAVPATPTPSATPLLDLASQVLAMLAKKNFPWMSEGEAAHAFVGQLVKADAEADKQKALDRAVAAANNVKAP